jgi:hypothetical protein
MELTIIPLGSGRSLRQGRMTCDLIFADHVSELDNGDSG